MAPITEEAPPTGTAGNTLLRRLRSLPAQTVMTVEQLGFAAISFSVQAVLLLGGVPNSDFSVFGLVILVPLSQWYLGRALASEPLLVSKAVDRLRGAAATALALGLLIGAGCLVAAVFFDGLTRNLLIAQAIASPLLAVYDHARYVTYVQRRPFLAVLGDTLWLLLFAVAAAVLVATGHWTVFPMYAAWLGAGMAMGLLAALRTGSPLALSAIRGWFRERRTLIPGFLIDAMYLVIGLNGTFYVARLVLGEDGFGLLRKALTPVTALTVLFVGIGNALLGHLAGRDAHQVRRAPATASGLAAVLTGFCAAVLLVLPSGMMTSVLGTDWSEFRLVSLLLLGYVLFLACGQLALQAAKATGWAWLGPRVRTVEMIVEISLVGLLGWKYGPIGSACGMATAWFLGAALAWLGLLGAGRKSAAESV
ncbi:hypothetical protein D5S17_15785 [Pseudonocardiaceae bacterium YIM PH 21723]|nr:hypothetical protein D5S17_15785 [Pseudonocardiaceae bacterium YIM PH 21723]